MCFCTENAFCVQVYEHAVSLSPACCCVRVCCSCFFPNVFFSRFSSCSSAIAFVVAAAAGKVMDDQAECYGIQLSLTPLRFCPP